MKKLLFLFLLCSLSLNAHKIFKVTIKDSDNILYVTFLNEDELDRLRHSFIFGGEEWDRITWESEECRDLN